jgi:TatD DNase family protein
VSWTDTHAHLFDPVFDQDREDVLARAKAADVRRMVVVGCEPAAWESVCAWASGGPGQVAIIGIHPAQAQETDAQDLLELQRRLADPGIRALGEVGLDYHWTPYSASAQRKLLDAQIALADQMGLPLVIHERDAFADLMTALAGVEVPVVLHCFSHGAKEAEDAMARGYYLSFAGPVTFPKSDQLRQAARICPSERILLETDSPYLSPHPLRSRRNEPAQVAITGEAVALVRQVSPATLMETVAENVQRVLGVFPELPG